MTADLTARPPMETSCGHCGSELMTPRPAGSPCTLAPVTGRAACSMCGAPFRAPAGLRGARRMSRAWLLAASAIWGAAAAVVTAGYFAVIAGRWSW